MDSNNQLNQRSRKESEGIAGIENDQAGLSTEEPQHLVAEVRPVDLGVPRPETNPKMTIT
jgi:hypothetical protein